MSLVIILVLRVFLLLGGFVGPDGWVTSVGLVSLNSIIHSAYPNAVIKTYSWNQYEKVAKDIRKHPRDTNVVAGFSGGGSRITWLANLKPHPRIDLAIFYDPSPKWQMMPIGPNIKRAVTYENKLPLFGGLGGGHLTSRKNGPKIRRIMIAEPHMIVQSDFSLHKRTLQEIRRLY